MKDTVVICGHISAGKTTLARDLGLEHYKGKALYIGVDELRDELFGKLSPTPQRSRELKERVKVKMDSVGKNITRILDSSLMSKGIRQMVRDMRERCIIIELRCSYLEFDRREHARSDRRALTNSVRKKSEGMVVPDLLIDTTDKSPDTVLEDAVLFIRATLD